MRALVAFKTSFDLLKGDKVAILLSLLPVAIGLTGLYFFSEWFFTGLRERILQYFGGVQESSYFLHGVVLALLAVFYYFVVNLLFVLMVSVVAAPFNDILSARIGKKLGEDLNIVPSKNFFQRAVWVWFNELKKIAYIVALTTFSFLLGFFPPLLPLSIVFSSLLLSISFLDYSWSRHGFTLKECIKDVRKHFWGYGISGFLFLFAFTIPVLNIFLVPYAVVYYTVMYARGNRGGKDFEGHLASVQRN